MMIISIKTGKYSLRGGIKEVTAKSFRSVLVSRQYSQFHGMKKLVWFRAILILPTRERRYVTAILKILVGLFVLVVAGAETAFAADAPKPSAHENRGVAERVGEAAENLSKKIEQAVNGVVKKFEEQRVGERFRETIENVATRTGEELERVGKKIEDKFSK
jgi:hypothetical protein